MAETTRRLRAASVMSRTSDFDSDSSHAFGKAAGLCYCKPTATTKNYRQGKRNTGITLASKGMIVEELCRGMATGRSMTIIHSVHLLRPLFTMPLLLLSDRL